MFNITTIHRHGVRHRHNLQPLAHMLDSARPVYYVDKNMDGSVDATYHVNLIYLLDRVFEENSLRFVSKEQENFLAIFLEEAGVVYDKVNTLRVTNGQDTDISSAYTDMNVIFLQLDDFLGNYIGVNNDRYAQ